MTPPGRTRSWRRVEVEAGHLSAQARQRLFRLLADDRADGGRFLRRLEGMRRIQGIAAHRAALEMLTRLDPPEDEAAELWAGIASHREALSAAMGRDPGLRVTVADYLGNVVQVLREPVPVEGSELDLDDGIAAVDGATGLPRGPLLIAGLRREAQRHSRRGATFSLALLQPLSVTGALESGKRAEAARRFRRCVRESDLVFMDSAGRFAAILPGTSRAGACEAALRVGGNWINGPEASVPTVAFAVLFGVATCPSDGTEPGALLTAAREDFEAAMQAFRAGYPPLTGGVF